MIALPMDVATLATVAVVVVASGWLVQYARERDAESATESVAGTVGSLALGAVTVVTVVVEQGLSGVADLVFGAAPWVGQALIGGLGWLGFSGWISLTPETWLVAVVAIVVVIAMIDLGT